MLLCENLLILTTAIPGVLTAALLREYARVNKHNRLVYRDHQKALPYTELCQNILQLYKSPLNNGVHVGLIVVNILCNWYIKLKYWIKSNGKFSHQFAACSGVRQKCTHFKLCIVCEIVCCQCVCDKRSVQMWNCECHFGSFVIIYVICPESEIIIICRVGC